MTRTASSPTRSIARRAACAVVLATIASIVPIGARGFAGVPPSVRHAKAYALADHLALTSRTGYVAFVDSLLQDARARNDADLELVASLHHASITAFGRGDLAGGLAEADLGLPKARAARDTLLCCLALRTRGFVQLVSQHYPEARAAYSEMLALARAARVTSMEGYARIGTGYLALQAGNDREAERHYRRAVRLLTARGDRFAARTAQAGLANSLYHRGLATDARREYEAVLAGSRADGDWRNAADALNDLASIDLLYDDPSHAAERYREAVVIHRRLGREAYALIALGNVAQCYQNMGRDDDAAAILDTVATVAAAIGARDAMGDASNGLAQIRIGQGRYADAEKLSRRIVSMGDSVNRNVRTEAFTSLAWALVQQGRPREACRELERGIATMNTDLTERASLLTSLGWSRIAAGIPDSAIAPLREALALRTNSGGLLGYDGIDNEQALGRAYADAGERDSALAHYRSSAARWEHHRSQPQDPAWREAFGSSAARLYGDYAAALLDPSRGGTGARRAEEAFAALQPFRARSLEDALRGGDARVAPPRVDLATLRRSTLRPRELFLDLYVSRDTSFLFAVTREGVRATGLPGRDALLPKLRRFADLLASGEGDGDASRAAAAALGEELFGSCADLARPARTVLLSAGAIGRFPLGMLRLPGENEALSARRQFAVVPSATLLAASRAAAAPATSGGRRLLALCRTTDATGRRLEGVARESRWLARELPHSEVRENDGRRGLDEMIATLGSHDVLHVASHARGTAGAPWRAGFLLGRGDGEEAYLTAARIARLRRPARVCVLAGCGSAGTTESAEAIPNLASAWLASGASAVIASLWPVGDDATARFVEEFYRSLFRGRTTGESLADAQRALSARGGIPARDWAGFVLVGDPDTRVAAARP